MVECGLNVAALVAGRFLPGFGVDHYGLISEIGMAIWPAIIHFHDSYIVAILAFAVHFIGSDDAGIVSKSRFIEKFKRLRIFFVHLCFPFIRNSELPFLAEGYEN